MRPLVLAVLLFESVFAFSQNPPPSIGEQRNDADSKRTAATAHKQNLGEVTTRLRQSVNGKALVRNQCQSQGHDVQVEESTEITAVDGCKVTFKTRKTTISPDGRRELEFTLFADLADLTTPPSVEPQTFPQCKPISGTVLKVMSRVGPGKVLRVTRQAKSEPAGGNSNTNEPDTQTARSDLSYFFPDAAPAKKAARALDQAVRLCGGAEWPDEDDLP